MQAQKPRILFYFLDDLSYQLKISSSEDIIDPKKESAKTDSQKIIFLYIIN